MAKQALSPMLFDKRVVERNIKKGVVKREDYDKVLAALPDVESQSELISARLGEDDDIVDDEEETDDDEG